MLPDVTSSSLAWWGSRSYNAERNWPVNVANKGDGLQLLKETPSDFTPLVFFDPQYRQVLNKLKYGNESARQSARAALPAMTDDVICSFGREIVRVLRPSGYCALWIDKFILCNLYAATYFPGDMQIVDLITWNKMRIGMGYRSRRKGEYLVILQKSPIRAKGTWNSHDIPDVWDEKIENRIHAHQKPAGLQKAIIGATCKPGDVVIDPCAGSFSVMVAANSLAINFLGCDIMGYTPTKEVA